MKTAKKPFTAKYLNEIRRNAILHATQPKSKDLTLYEAPPVVLERAIVTLKDVIAKLRGTLRMKRAAEKKGKYGTVEYDMEMIRQINRNLERERKGR